MEKPKYTTSEIMDLIRDRAILLSEAIKDANAQGISVHVQKAPEGSEQVVQLVYSV